MNYNTFVKKIMLEMDKPFDPDSLDTGIISENIEWQGRGIMSPAFKEKILYVVAMEELSELSKEISKELRGEGDYFRMIEEISDTIISLIYLLMMRDISMNVLMVGLKVKLDRIREKMEKEKREAGVIK